MAKSQISRGLLFGAEFFTQLFKEVVKLGGTEEAVYEKMKSNSTLVKEFAKLIVVGVNGVKDVLRILANLSLPDRIARGKYDWVNDNITEKHFPTGISADYDAEYRLFHFDRDISSEAATQEMEKEGFRPGTLAELLALGETQPELQKQFSIIALGSVWQVSSGRRNVPELCWFVDRRKLSLVWFEYVWNASYRFLAVRK